MNRKVSRMFMPALLAVGTTTLSGCFLFGVQPQQQEQAAAPAAAPEPEVPDTDPDLLSSAEWMNHDGTIVEDMVYATVRSMCKEQTNVRVTAKWDSGPKCMDSDCDAIVAPWFDKYTFFNDAPPKFGGRSLVEIHVNDTQDLREAMFWVEDEDGAWIKQPQIEAEFGNAYALELDKDCKTLRPRESGLALHGCYRWHYSAGCGLDRDTMRESSPQPVLPCGDGSVLSVEGDMSNPTCTFETEHGYCKIAAGDLHEDCSQR